MKFFLSVTRFIDTLNEITGRAVSWLTLLMVVLVTADVLLRYLFHVSFVAVQELEWHLFAVVFLLGGGYTLKHNGHVRVDVVYQRLGRRTRAWINILGCVFLLFPGCYLMIKTSIPFVESSFSLNETSPDPGGLPARWLLKLMIPAAFMLMGLQGVALFVQSIMEAAGLAGKKSEDEQTGEKP